MFLMEAIIADENVKLFPRCSLKQKRKKAHKSCPATARNGISCNRMT